MNNPERFYHDQTLQEIHGHQQNSYNTTIESRIQKKILKEMMLARSNSSKSKKSQDHSTISYDPFSQNARNPIRTQMKSVDPDKENKNIIMLRHNLNINNTNNNSNDIHFNRESILNPSYSVLTNNFSNFNPNPPYSSSGTQNSYDYHQYSREAIQAAPPSFVNYHVNSTNSIIQQSTSQLPAGLANCKSQSKADIKILNTSSDNLNQPENSTEILESLQRTKKTVSRDPEACGFSLNSETEVFVGTSNFQQISQKNQMVDMDSKARSVSITPCIISQKQTISPDTPPTQQSFQGYCFLPEIQQRNQTYAFNSNFAQLRESNQKSLLELPNIVEGIKKCVQSSQSLFNQRFQSNLRNRVKSENGCSNLEDEPSQERARKQRLCNMSYQSSGSQTARDNNNAMAEVERNNQLMQILNSALEEKQKIHSHGENDSLDREFDQLTLLTSKNSDARNDLLQIQQDVIRINLKKKLGRFSIIDTYDETQESQ